jgi:hypothetical protein
MKKLYASLACIALLAGSVHAQTFTKLAGQSATSNGVHPGITETTTPTYKEFQLTTNEPIEQRAAVWNNATYSLTGNWTVKAQVNLGPWDETNPDPTRPLPVYTTGADGMALVLSTAQYLGQWGEEVGYGTRDVLAPGAPYVPNNSLAFEMDTWENTTTGFNGAHGYLNHNEPGDGNHVAFMSKGNSIHGGGVFPAIGAKRTLSFDLETAGWIDVQISWADATNTLSIVSSSHPNLNSSIILSNADLTTIFGSATPTLYLGFTAATGSAANNHRIRWMLPPPNCGQLRTQTQGGWGTCCNGNNPGCYRNANFAAAFPNGARIGDVGPGKRSLLFTTSLAVQNFLPSGGQSKTLAQLGLPAGQTTNPSGNSQSSGRSNINGQLLALTLSVGFDNYDPNFGPAGVKLEDMIIKCGAYRGWTVKQFLAYANQYIGGSGTNSNIISNIQQTAAKINENYVSGVINRGFLVCPGQPLPDCDNEDDDNDDCHRTNRILEGDETGDEDANDKPKVNVSVFPNPTRNQLNVNLDKLPAGSEVQVINSRGVMMTRRAAGGAQVMNFNVSQYERGIYFVKVLNNNEVIQTIRVLLF